MTVENAWEYQGGSSLAMRMTQLDISYKAFLKSPLIGNGTKATSIVTEQNPELLGAESIWFTLLIEKGILGILAFLTLIFFPILNKQFINKKIYCALSFSWLALNTMTTVPGMGATFFLTLVMLVRKAEILNYKYQMITK